MAVLWNLLLLVLLQSYLVETQTTLTYQVNGHYVSSPPKPCPGDLLNITYSVSIPASSIIFKLRNGTCNNSYIGSAIVVDLGAAVCNGPSGYGSCGPFYAKSIYGGGTMPCTSATLSFRVNSTENSPIEFGTHTTDGIVNITDSIELIHTKDPGYLNVSVIPGLTNLTVMWLTSPSGGSPDYYNVTLMNGTAVVYDTKNVQSDKTIILNLHNNTLYQLKVAAINCASSSVYNSSASTLSYPPLNIAAAKKEINGSGFVLTVKWIHVGGSVTGYQIALKCCNAVPMLADVETYCKTPLSCSFSIYLTLSVDELNFLTVSAHNSGGIGPESELIAVTQDGTNGGQDIQTILAASLTPAALVAIVGVGTVAILLVKHLWRKYETQNASNTEMVASNVHGGEGVDSGPNGDIYDIGGEGVNSGPNGNIYDIKIPDTNSVVVQAEVIQESELVATRTEGSEVSQLCISLPLKSSNQMNVNVSTEVINYLKGLFNKTMPNIDIFDVKYIVNQEVLTEYVNCAASIKKKYADHYMEKLMFRGTLLSSPEYCIGYGLKTWGTWGHGYYFTEDAIHADIYAFHHADTQIWELTVALVITGHCYHVIAEETPPKEDPVRHEVYDSCAGIRKSSHNANITSKSCVVFDVAQTCPVIRFSYKKSSSKSLP